MDIYEAAGAIEEITGLGFTLTTELKHSNSVLTCFCKFHNLQTFWSVSWDSLVNQIKKHFNHIKTSGYSGVDRRKRSGYHGNRMPPPPDWGGLKTRENRGKPALMEDRRRCQIYRPGMILRRESDRDRRKKVGSWPERSGYTREFKIRATDREDIGFRLVRIEEKLDRVLST